MQKLLTSTLLSIAAVSVYAQAHPILALGSSAPDFKLPGVDGKVHKLSDYARSPVLVVVFTCDHCPIAQVYERRIEKLYEDYGKRGVAVVAIQGNYPKALTIDELDSSDMSDTLEEMMARFAWKHLHLSIPLRWRNAVGYACVRTAGYAACLYLRQEPPPPV